MKVTLVTAALLLLSGCGSIPTLEELERQAMHTGDWSEVEKRERIIARREARRSSRCPDGFVGYCETSFGRERCQCIASDVLRDAFAGIY